MESGIFSTTPLFFPYDDSIEYYPITKNSAGKFLPKSMYLLSSGIIHACLFTTLTSPLSQNYLRNGRSLLIEPDRSGRASINISITLLDNSQPYPNPCAKK